MHGKYRWDDKKHLPKHLPVLSLGQIQDGKNGVGNSPVCVPSPFLGVLKVMVNYVPQSLTLPGPAVWASPGNSSELQSLPGRAPESEPAPSTLRHAQCKHCAKTLSSHPQHPHLTSTCTLASDLRSASAPGRPLKFSPRGPAAMAGSPPPWLHPGPRWPPPWNCPRWLETCKAFCPPKRSFMHEEKDLFLGVNCQGILAHPVPLLPLAQLERSYCFLAYNSKGSEHRQGTRRGLQEQLSVNGNKMISAQSNFLSTHPFLPSRPPR